MKKKLWIIPVVIISLSIIVIATIIILYLNGSFGYDLVYEETEVSSGESIEETETEQKELELASGLKGGKGDKTSKSEESKEGNVSVIEKEAEDEIEILDDEDDQSETVTESAAAVEEKEAETQKQNAGSVTVLTKEDTAKETAETACEHDFKEVKAIVHHSARYRTIKHSDEIESHWIPVEGEADGGHWEDVVIQTSYEEKELLQEAYDEEVVAGYKCKKCGEKKGY